MSLPVLVVGFASFLPTRPTPFAADIVTIQRSDWKKGQSFFDRNAPGVITALALSPNGAYLASASQFMVYIWSTDTRQILAK